MGDDADAARPEPRVLGGARDLAAELGAELAPDGRDVDAHLLEHAPAAHQADHATAAALARPRLALEAAWFALGRAGQRLGLVLDGLERGAELVTQAFEPGARGKLERVM